MKTTLALLAGLALLAACREAPQASSVLGAAPAPAAPPPAAAPAPVPEPAAAPAGHFRARLAAASGGDIAFVIEGSATLQRDAAAAPRRWRLEGRQVLSVQWIRCTPTASPAEQPLQDAWLEIEDGSSPARYRLQAGSNWNATVAGSCPGLGLGSASVPMRVPGRLEASGTLAADGSVRGERVDGPLRWEWSFPTAP